MVQFIDNEKDIEWTILSRKFAAKNNNHNNNKNKQTMGENWIGKAVSIKCVDEFGIFQGTIKDANSTKIVISHAFRNGLPLKTPDAEVTIK